MEEVSVEEALVVEALVGDLALVHRRRQQPKRLVDFNPVLSRLQPLHILGLSKLRVVVVLISILLVIEAILHLHPHHLRK